MEILKGMDFKIKDSAVSLGKFDGIHLGHRLLLNEVLGHKELIPTVFTFGIDNGSKAVPSGKLVYSWEEKRIILEDIGIKRTILFPFNEETKNMEPEDFIEKFLIEKMDARFICVGTDFCFGKNRRGNAGLLKAFAARYGYTVKIFNKIKSKDGIISSTLIRRKIEDGDIKGANELLGRTYFIEGTVVHGNALGRRLGMPTANIYPWEGKVLLPPGVYASALVLNGKRYPSVTNIGRKPTVGSDRTVVETCILDFKEDIYGCRVFVEFHEFLRPEKKFPDIMQLKTQMEQDKKRASEVLRYYL
ncbi:MAG: bifunctional riboflavin kinase/FAD synthetase [Lachnospiraceae bacterium]|nr:bifunctional riboflavin kinase/FAD synthetase [Lachnospiraceae bacterium]